MGRQNASNGFVRWFVLCCFCLLLVPSVLAEPAVPSILVLYENSRLLPATIEADQGFSDAVAASGLPVEVNSEFLGYPQFASDAYTAAIVPYLRTKYETRKPTLVVVGGSAALGFWLAHRAEILPGVPVIHMGVGAANLNRLIPPGDVYGVPVQYDAVATVRLALTLLPATRRLVVISGSSDFDRTWKSVLVDQDQLKGQVDEVVSLEGLPTDALLSRVKQVSSDSIIFTAGYFVDGAGQKFAPRDIVKRIADVSPVPVFGPFDTFIGTGVVGGRVPTFRDMGAMAGTIAVQILRGGELSDLHLPVTMPLRALLDDRQIQRWGIKASSLPPDADLKFRTPGLWEQYRGYVVAALAVLMVQSLLLARLLVERRRRRKVEGVADRHRFELAHASRLAVAGQLTASIAHEINQPLGAIQSNVAALSMILRDGGAREDVAPILDDIRRDNLRANDVIRQLRALIEKHEVERVSVNLSRCLTDTETILRGETRRKGVVLSTSFSSTPVEVIGDRVQLQQVLINLVMNAMDAVSANPAGERFVSMTLHQQDGQATIIVSDNGPGIAPDHLDKLFDSFFSTKKNGMGLGLSIVRTLIDAHGGRAWGANRAGGGASFGVELPLRETDAIMLSSQRENA